MNIKQIPFEKLLKDNADLIEKAVKRSIGYTNLKREDLKQEARMALYKAQQCWDEDKGMSFNSYAFLLMKRCIFNAIRSYNKQYVDKDKKRKIYPRDITFSELEEE